MAAISFSRSQCTPLDGYEEILSRLLTFLRDDLVRERISSGAEKKRLEFIRSIDLALQDAGARQIAAKYEPAANVINDGGHRLGSVLQGNVVPTPFSRSTVEDKLQNPSNTCSKNMEPNKEAMVTYETIPCDLELYDTEEVRAPVKGKSKEVPAHGAAGDRSSMNGSIYEEAFGFSYVPDTVPEASESDSETDYEEYVDTYPEEKEHKKKKTEAKVTSQKKSSRRRQEKVNVDLSKKTFSGSLFRKKTFQFQRRFCVICGSWFICYNSESSLKRVVQICMNDYEVIIQEKRDGKTSYPYELRLACPGKETHLFYTDSRQTAEEWVKELQKASLVKQQSLDSNPDEEQSVSEEFDKQSLCSETNISGGSFDKTMMMKTSSQQSDNVQKKSKLQSLLGTVGKKLGKTKTALHSLDFGTPQQIGEEPDSGCVYIQSEEYTGDRWFKRFCRIENGRLNCYKDSQRDARPEFSLPLNGAQLKPLEERDELKIRLIVNGMEHCLKMEDFMEHGKWLMSLIRETGFANQLLKASKDSKQVTQNPACVYEELRQFYGLEGVTLDETCLGDDDEPPPLPVCSPPPTPSSPDGKGGCLRGKADKTAAAPEGIYLEPVGWLVDAEDVKRKKKVETVSSLPPMEESTYINKDFAGKCNNVKRKTKENNLDKGMNSSNSFPNLTSIGASLEAKDKKTEMEKVKRRQGAVAGKTAIPFRAVSALVESAENLTEEKESTKPSFSSAQPPDNTKKYEYLISATGYQQKLSENAPKVKSSNSYSHSDHIRDDVIKTTRCRRTASTSNEELSRDGDRNKNLVQDLVKMFERRDQTN